MPFTGILFFKIHIFNFLNIYFYFIYFYLLVLQTTENTTPTTRGQYLITLEVTRASFDDRFFFGVLHRSHLKTICHKVTVF